MDFIYRIPLLEFDPRDESKISQNWEEIKTKIMHSSPSLHAAIQTKSYEEISQGAKLKVYKYLLRGKYRSTPFGRWSAVGTGIWADQTITIVNLSTSVISKPQKYADNESFVLAKGINYLPSLIRFWFFDGHDEKWAYSIVYRNKLIDLVLDYFSKNTTLGYLEFSKWFKNIDEITIKSFWNKTLETGLIQSLSLWKDATGDTRINLKSNSCIQLDARIREELNLFIGDMASFFVSYKRPILDNFKRLFHRYYDDRFVPLDLLIHDNCILDELFAEKDSNPNGDTGLNQALNFHLGLEEIDLKKGFQSGDLSEDIQDIQLSFHLGPNNNIHIDNIVCNRPFVFIGRFTEDPDIYALSKKQNPVPNELENIIFCDIEVLESSTVNFISRHQNCFKHYLSPVSDNSGDAIPLEELYIGISRGQIVLVWKSKTKQIIPVFQHPLNGSQITHPLFRLLWEISNQSSFKFLPYLHDTLLEPEYTPRLRWGSIIVQERKWLLVFDRFSDNSQLKKYLEDQAVPTRILAGNEDRELVLDWKDLRDFGLLWDELKKRGKLSVYDATAVIQSPFKSIAGGTLHPQFIHKKKYASPKNQLPEYVNYLEGEDTTCLYFRIAASPNTLLILLKDILPRLISKLLETKPDLKWYFLLYQLPENELRLRFLNLSPQEIKRIKGMVDAVFYLHVPWGAYHRAPYYPEYQKYGWKFLPFSESIFHWESSLMLFGHASLKKPLIYSSGRFRAKVVSEIWKEVLLQSGRCGEYLEELKGMLKTVPLEEIRKIRAHFDTEIDFLTLPEITEEYVTMIRLHEFHCSKVRQKSFLFNHFHMMVNRFFPIESTDFEDISRYLCYRKLGRAYFQRRQEQASKENTCPKHMTSL